MLIEKYLFILPALFIIPVPTEVCSYTGVSPDTFYG